MKYDLHILKTKKSLKDIMLKILAIDPGDIQSAYVLWNNDKIEDKGILSNDKIRKKLYNIKNDTDIIFAIEMIASYGMPVGKSIFETCVWIGRFIEIWGRQVELVYRQSAKMNLCHFTKAKDSNVRQALIDRFPPTGEGKCSQIGTKKKPGPLYGVTEDIWSALAVAMYVNDTKLQRRNGYGKGERKDQG